LAQSAVEAFDVLRLLTFAVMPIAEDNRLVSSP